MNLLGSDLASPQRVAKSDKQPFTRVAKSDKQPFRTFYGVSSVLQVCQVEKSRLDLNGFTRSVAAQLSIEFKTSLFTGKAFTPSSHVLSCCLDLGFRFRILLLLSFAVLSQVFTLVAPGFYSLF